MTQDKIIELAIKANAEISKLQIWNIATNKYDFYKTLTFEWAHLTKFAELILASQAQPTPNQSEPVARFVKDSNSCSIITLANIENGALLYTKPQPTSQDVVDAERYRYIRDAGASFTTGLHTDNEKDHHACEWAMDDAIDAAMKESK